MNDCRAFSFDTAMTPMFDTFSGESLIVPSDSVPTHRVGLAGSRIASSLHDSGRPAGSDERRSRMTTPVEIAPSAPSATELGPVRPSERIAELDILRGFALLGILVVNLFVFHTPLSLRGSTAVDLYPCRLDKAVRWIIRASAHFGQGWRTLTLAPSMVCLYISLGRLHRPTHSEPTMLSIQRSSVDEIVRHFEELEDPRSAVNLQHPLVSVVVIALLAVLAGANGPTAIAKWAALKEEFLVAALDLPNGIPGKDVFRRVLMTLKPAAFQACFANWLRSLRDAAAAATGVN
jgi:hypothetical protein